MKLNANRTGIVLGLFLAGVHFLWSIIVAFGWGQMLLNFVFWMHMLSSPYLVMYFDVTAAALLLIVTFIAGYVIGWAFANLWNKFYKTK